MELHPRHDRPLFRAGLNEIRGHASRGAGAASKGHDSSRRRRDPAAGQGYVQLVPGSGVAAGTTHRGTARGPGFHGGRAGFRPGAVFRALSAVFISGDARASRRTFRLLRSKHKELPEDILEDVKALLVVEQEIVDRFHAIVGRKIAGQRIRCHGDYHLGQVLFTGKDFIIIDFEGEPSRRISERRLKRCPLRDVAGMVRSFDYVGQSVLYNQLSAIVQKEKMPELQQWAQFWSLWTSVGFVRAYLQTLGETALIPQSPNEAQTLLDVFLLDKAVYEMGYELNNRPSWVRIPLQGILRTLESCE